MESWTNCPLAPIIVIKKAKRNKLGLMMKTAIIVPFVVIVRATSCYGFNGHTGYSDIKTTGIFLTTYSFGLDIPL